MTITKGQIKEIESLLPDHFEALTAFGADMYKQGIIKGGIAAVIGCSIAIVGCRLIDAYKSRKNN